MHFSLRDSYRRHALFAEVALLATSVIFLVTTFAGPYFYQSLGMDEDYSKLVLGLASTTSFFFSLVLLLLDWPGKAASHKDSADRWSKALAKFRESRLEDKSWNMELADQLSRAYDEACDNSVSIPDKKFNSLKIKYLTKVEVSKMASKYPGAPHFILWFIVIFSASKNAISNR